MKAVGGGSFKDVYAWGAQCGGDKVFLTTTLTFYSLWLKAETVIGRKVTAASLICPEVSAHSVPRNADPILTFFFYIKVCMYACAY